MALRSAFTELFGIRSPIALAPMGGSAGGALAAAVSNGGGLGLVGGGREVTAWLERELALAAASSAQPWGVGFQSWSTSVDVVSHALEFEPHVVMLSFGDPRPLAPAVAAAGVALIIQVTSRAEAEVAIDLGADVIVAQGTEAGGHSGTRATLPFVPIVVDMAGSTPVLAAGGIADGRGIAAALALGAAGALVGTRFLATTEALIAAEDVKAILDGRGEDTERSRVLDIARGAPWPQRYPARTLRNAFLDEWRGREEELEADDEAKAAYRAAAARGDVGVVPIWASEAIDLITDISSASALVELLAKETEEALVRAGHAVVSGRT